MSVRAPYIASSLLHVTALGLLLAISALQKSAPMIPSVRIVALPGGGRTGPRAAAAPVHPAPEVAPAPRVEPPVVEPPKAKPKPAPKTPPPKPAARPADPKGTLPPEKREIVSKGPAPASPKSAAAAARGAAVPAAAGAGDGAKNLSTTRGVGIEADGDPGPLSGYLGLLRDKVAANWTPPLAAVRKGEVRAVISFVVASDGGAPRDVAVAVSSGDSNFDRSAMRAVAYANPLPPLPSNWAGDAIGIRFTFYQEY